jgi:hypothetical protein
VYVVMMAVNLVLPLEHFKGFRPANCRTTPQGRSTDFLAGKQKSPNET